LKEFDLTEIENCRTSLKEINVPKEKIPDSFEKRNNRDQIECDVNFCIFGDLREFS
jgi:hypothetical protein